MNRMEVNKEALNRWSDTLLSMGVYKSTNEILLAIQSNREVIIDKVKI